MAKSRSTRGRPVRQEGSRSSASGRYDSERITSGSRYEGGQGRSEQDNERGSNGGPRSRSLDYKDERDTPGFVSRVGRTFSEMDFEKAMVLLNVALAVAIVIKQSKDQDRSRKGQPLRSAVSILNHYLNEGQELTESQRASLADIKKDMRKLYAPEDEESYSPAGG
ncbi:MAG TPA: DUF3175 domain-containing protein [Candidatus Krumholzibacteria bacterium]|jgi:hypothetical protein|nr:DUF3175 domain-containing protein [Candidatus Krumholzibacteria bacterium]